MIKGTMPLMQHRMDDEALLKLMMPKSYKKKDKEELTPRELADKHAYKNSDGFIIPTSYFVSAFKSVASEYKQKNSTRKSIKSIAGGIFRPEHEFEQLLDHKSKPVTQYEVDIRKGTNHQKGAIAICRPRFDQWAVELTALVDTDLVTEDMFLEILNDSGRRAGVGSYRVSCGGPYGTFNVTGFERLTQ